jgi:calcium-binding protein CML
MFQKMDVNGDGQVTIEEVKHLLQQIGSKMTEMELLKMMKQIDTNGDGCLNFDEFSTAVRSGWL